MDQCPYTPHSPAPGCKREAGIMVPDEEALPRETSSTVSPDRGESPLRYDWDDIA